MPLEMDDASGSELRSNESLTKDTVACCWTCDLERPRKITKVKVGVLLQTFCFLGNFFLSFSTFCVLSYSTVGISDYLAANVEKID
jgi:hypothetical protein